MPRYQVTYQGELTTTPAVREQAAPDPYTACLLVGQVVKTKHPVVVKVVEFQEPRTVYATPRRSRQEAMRTAEEFDAVKAEDLRTLPRLDSSQVSE